MKNRLSKKCRLFYYKFMLNSEKILFKFPEITEIHGGTFRKKIRAFSELECFLRDTFNADLARITKQDGNKILTAVRMKRV